MSGLAVLALDDDRRPQILLAARRAGAPVDHDALGDAGRLVERFRHRLAFDEILEGDRALDLGEDRPGVRIPFGDALAALDLVALVDLHARTVLDAVHGTLGAVLIDDGDRILRAMAISSPSELRAMFLFLMLDRAFEVQLDERLLVDLRRAADVERAHGELRARLADRLGRDDAHRLAHVDRSAAGKVAPVALAAHAVGRLAGEHRTDAHLLHASHADRLDMRLLDQRAALDDHVAVSTDP